MSYIEHFRNYSDLKALFWPEADSLPHIPADLHPLLALIMGDNVFVANETNRSANLIRKYDENWIKSASKRILKEKDYRNVSAALGEVRAYGVLLDIWSQYVCSVKSGADFKITFPNFTVRVEVNTPQHKDKDLSCEFLEEYTHEYSDGKKIKINSSYNCPFGFPEHSGDNVQGEAVSKLAQIKYVEHQFEETDVNVLWLDFQDPNLWHFNLRDQLIPLLSHNCTLTSGALWSAYYGEKGLPVYSSSPTIYHMQFHGRFYSKTLIDFVVLNMVDVLAVYENPNKDKPIPDDFYRSLHDMKKFRLELSWIDWPCSNSLSDRISYAKKLIRSYENSY